jgi:hypothetical protein
MSLKTHRVFCSAAFISDRRDSASISDTFLIPNRSPHATGTFQFFFSEHHNISIVAVTQIF